MVLARTVQVPQGRVRPVDVALEQAAGRDGLRQTVVLPRGGHSRGGGDRSSVEHYDATTLVTAKQKWGKWSVERTTGLLRVGWGGGGVGGRRSTGRMLQGVVVVVRVDGFGVGVGAGEGAGVARAKLSDGQLGQTAGVRVRGRCGRRVGLVQQGS